jgi:Zn-dependent peptidase ImmA (M78 family)
MYKKRIKLIVNQLRKQYGITTVPVNLDKLTKRAGIAVKYENFDEVLSGFVYQKHGIKYIGVNSEHTNTRKRFTIAHELGHLFLHKNISVNYDQGVMLFRDSHASDGTDLREIQANQFAAELLMPEDSVRDEVAKLGLRDLMDDEVIEELAEKYNVSSQAMAVRLSNLYLDKF